METILINEPEEAQSQRPLRAEVVKEVMEYLNEPPRKDKRFRELGKHIPNGVYCYDERGKCPFWDIDMNAPTQQNGYCHLLGEGDNDSDGLGLLWDQCKSCGINDGWDDDEDST